jgi:hypothetical protein
VLVGDGFERFLLDCSAFLDLLDEAEDWYFKVDGAQF